MLHNFGLMLWLDRFYGCLGAPLIFEATTWRPEGHGCHTHLGVTVASKRASKLIRIGHLKLLLDIVFVLFPGIGNDDGLEAVGGHSLGALTISTTLQEWLLAVHVTAIHVDLRMLQAKHRVVPR